MASESPSASAASAASTGAGGPPAEEEHSKSASEGVLEGSTTVAERRAPLFIPNDFEYDPTFFSIPPHYMDSISCVLAPHGLVLDRVSRMAQDLRRDYAGRTPHLLCVLKGGHEFFTDLCRALRTEHLYSDSTALPFTFDFVRLSSYHGTESTGVVTIGLEGVKPESLTGKDIILVEDIVDTGLSMSKLIPRLMTVGPKSVEVCTLLEKRTSRGCGFKAKYVGFSVPDRFVIGYNMDYNEVFRELPHICVINDHGIQKYKDY